VLGETLLVRSPEIGLEAYVARPVAAGTLGTAAGPADGSQAPDPGTSGLTPEVDMVVLIVSVGILLALVVTLTVMGRRERRTRELIALEESGMLDARRPNDATGER
jgi:hypothetical protein